MTTDPESEMEDAMIPSAADDKYVSVGARGLLAASEKLLHMSRGLSGDDQRDALQFKRVMTPAKLMAERVKLDTGGVIRGVMRHIARHRSLKGFATSALDPLTTKFVTSNGQLVSPIEEINPIDILGQHRRITLMGPGGIGSADSVTGQMQAIHPSQFGFISGPEGPECFDDRTEVYTERGWVSWPDVKSSDVFACNVDGWLEWHPASRIIATPYRGTMLVGENESIRMCVTPNHRVVYSAGGSQHSCPLFKIDTAEHVYGKSINIPVTHAPCLGDENIKHFCLPAIPVTNNHQKVHGPLDIVDWSKVEYDGTVYCATVPGGLLLVRGKPKTAGFWSGNSGAAGIDVRMAHGVKLGDNGRLYQRFRNPKTGHIHWLSPEDLGGKTVGLPQPAPLAQ